MSIFKKYICSECCQKTSHIAKRFNNEKILCKSCADFLLTNNLPSNISYGKYREIKEYQEINFSRHCQLFKETHSYKNIHMDAKSHLFYIGDKVNKNTVFLSFQGIKSCDFNYSVPLGATVAFGSIACTVSVSIVMRRPNVSYKYTLSDRARAIYEDSEYQVDIFGDDYYVDSYSYDYPSSLKTFLKHFYDACEKTGSRTRNESNDSELNAFRKELEKDPLMYACHFSDEQLREIKMEKELAKAYQEQLYDEELEEQALLDCVDAADVFERSELTEEEYNEVMEFLQNEEQ